MANKHNLQKDISKYKKIYIGLLFCTVITVAISYLNVPIGVAVVLALLVATFKASLVAGTFMHLIHEKLTVVGILIFSFFCFLSLIMLIIFSQYSVFDGLEYIKEKPIVQAEIEHLSEEIKNVH